MEVKAGFKQSDVGIIPEDWNTFPLSQCAKRIKDGEHWTPRRSSSGYYLLSARNILNSRIDLSDVDYVEEDEYKRIRQRCNPEEGDVIISCSGTVGRVAVVPKGLECVMVRSAAMVKPDHQKLNGLFAQYYLQSAIGQKQIAIKVNQGAQPNLFLNHIEDLLISLPPILAEQEAIAEALSDADAFIEALEQLIAKKRQVKQSVKEELLTRKIRLPGFIEEWKEKTIGEIAIVTDFSANGSFADLRTNVKYMSTPGYAILVRLVDFSNKWSGDFVYVPKYSYDFLKKSKLSVGDLVISNIGYAGILFQVPDLGMPMTLGPNALVIKTDDYPNTSREYLYHYLSSVDGQNRIKFIVTQSAQPKFNKTDFRNMQIPFPKKEEQTAIAEILSDMDAEIAALEAKLAKARQVKQGMMSELLTGRVRLV